MYKTINQDIAEVIAQFGVHITCVPQSGFAYTTGLHLMHDHAELLIHGLPYRTAGDLLNILTLLIRDNAKYVSGRRIVLPGIPPAKKIRLGFRSLNADERRVTVTAPKHFYGHDNFDALQVLWSDRNDNLPGEKGCSPSVEIQQILLLV